MTANGTLSCAQNVYTKFQIPHDSQNKVTTGSAPFNNNISAHLNNTCEKKHYSHAHMMVGASLFVFYT